MSLTSSNPDFLGMLPWRFRWSRIPDGLCDELPLRPYLRAEGRVRAPPDGSASRLPFRGRVLHGEAPKKATSSHISSGVAFSTSFITADKRCHPASSSRRRFLPALVKS